MRTALKGCGCTPFTLSSGAVYHSGSCRESPNQRLTRAESDVWRMQNRAADREAAELLRASLMNHPAKGDKQPLRSVKDDDYQNAHADDLDDYPEAE